jgi:two-component system response regulator PhoP
MMRGPVSLGGTLARALKTLVVEDDAALRQLMKLTLEKRGHIVSHEAGRGDDPMIFSCDVDVALVDLGLPGKSGLDVIRALSDRRVPSLVLSASAHSAAVTEALLAGALGYIVKGSRLADVVDAVELVADRKQVIPAADGSGPIPRAPRAPASRP